MNIDENASVKELESLKRRIEQQIKAKKSKKVDKAELYKMIKDDHARHRRQDGRKVFRSVVDYLECYVSGLPPIAKSNFYSRFGIEGRRTKVTPEIVAQAQSLLNEGKTLSAVASLVGVSTATCQKIKKGDYN